MTENKLQKSKKKNLVGDLSRTFGRSILPFLLCFIEQLTDGEEWGISFGL